MASIETRLYEWAATIYDRELDEEDKDTLYDELVRAADEIKELLTENKELRDERDVDHDANIALYSALEEERKKNEWVSVKDRLPEDNKLKLVVQVDCGDQYYGLDWLSIKGENWWFKANTRITHWMPLPELPKGEEE